MRGLPEDFQPVVKANFRDTTGWLVARSEPCLSVSTSEAGLRGRRVSPIDPERLSKHDFGGKWFAAILVCPGDDLAPVFEWYRHLGASDRRRVRFHCHPGVDLDAAFEGGRALGIPMDSIVVLHDMTFAGFHGRVFGMDLSKQIYRDATGQDVG